MQIAWSYLSDTFDFSLKFTLGTNKKSILKEIAHKLLCHWSKSIKEKAMRFDCENDMAYELHLTPHIRLFTLFAMLMIKVECMSPIDLIYYSESRNISMTSKRSNLRAL